MKKIFLLVFISLFLYSSQLIAGSVSIGISLPLIMPGLIVVPGTNVYAAPYGNVDIFFSDGYYYHENRGRWYRSRDYYNGWKHYDRSPRFYRNVPRGWKNNYWRGNPHNYNGKRFNGNPQHYNKKEFNRNQRQPDRNYNRDRNQRQPDRNYNRDRNQRQPDRNQRQQNQNYQKNRNQDGRGNRQN